MRIEWSIAALSWIDPVTGLPEVDTAGDPGVFVSRGRIVAASGYRFSNFLEAWIEVDTSAQALIGGNFSAASGMYRGPSFLNTVSAPVGRIGRRIIRTPTAVTFRQLVGCRTMAPEKIGRTVGAVIGAPLGPVTGYVGYRAGRAVAEVAKVFPPIWTELELTIRNDGNFSHALLRHSLFPSVSYYAPETSKMNTGVYKRSASYDAVPMLDSWYDRGWGTAGPADSTGRPGAAPTPGNPWRMTKPTFTATSTLTDQPQGY